MPRAAALVSVWLAAGCVAALAQPAPVKVVAPPVGHMLAPPAGHIVAPQPHASAIIAPAPSYMAGIVAVCSATDPAIGAARALRLRRDFDGAMNALKPILDRNSNDIQANYLAGLILIDQSRGQLPGQVDKDKANQGIARLIATAKLIDRADQACAQKNNWYVIYSTIGAENFNLGNYAQAEYWLQTAYAKRALLTDAMRKKLLTNLGQFYYDRQNYAAATRYYGEAASAGAPGAQQNLAITKELSALFRTEKR